MVRALPLICLLLAGCTDRALGLGGRDDVLPDGGHDGAVPNGDGSISNPMPIAPGGLPAVYCERIITLSDTGDLALFDPSALTFTDTGKLDCNAGGGSGPYSIALDGEGVLWAVYSSGDLFTADAQSGACKPTTFQRDQSGFHNFDLTFAPDPVSGKEAIFASSVADFGKSQLGEIDPQALVVKSLGGMNANVELTATKAGEVWGMFRGSNPHASRINLSTLALGPDLKIPLGDITGDGLAFSSFNGSFYVFLLPHNSSTSVFGLSTSDGSLTNLLTKTGRRIISATIAVCR